MEVGVLLGQNANSLLPTGGSGPHKVEGLRVRRTVLGKFGYIWDGYHPYIWTPDATNSADLERKAPEDEFTETTHEPLIQFCHIKFINKLNCSCSPLSVPRECAPCTSAIKLADSPHLQSLRHTITRTSKLEKARGIMARILRASAAITKAKHPGGYKDFSKDEMDAIMQKPLSAEDYEKADRIMLLLMQPQVKTLLDSQSVGKKKAKNIQGMSTLLE